MNRSLFNVCGFDPFFPLFFSSPFPLMCLMWYKIIQSLHLHITSPPLFPPLLTHCNTSFCSCKSPPPQSSSSLITWLCGCVWSGVFPPILSSSPSFLGEGAYALGARGGNSPARRGDWGETLLKQSADKPSCLQKGLNNTALTPRHFPVIPSCLVYFFLGKVIHTVLLVDIPVLCLFQKQQFNFYFVFSRSSSQSHWSLIETA